MKQAEKETKNLFQQVFFVFLQPLSEALSRKYLNIYRIYYILLYTFIQRK